MHEIEILSTLREAMSEDDSERVEEIIDEYEDDWEDGSLAVKALEIAVETGNYDYIDEHVDDFDTTEMGYLLDHTDDDEIIALLNDHGIFRDWEDYGDCLFAFFAERFGKSIGKNTAFLTGMLKSLLTMKKQWRMTTWNMTFRRHASI